MAILAMDQYAHVLASESRGPCWWRSPGRSAPRSAGGVAVLAPSRWLRAADVLPHNWDATSDSVAAFVAGALDAERLDADQAGRGWRAAEQVDACFAAGGAGGVAVVEDPGVGASWQSEEQPVDGLELIAARTDSPRAPSAAVRPARPILRLPDSIGGQPFGAAPAG